MFLTAYNCTEVIASVNGREHNLQMDTDSEKNYGLNAYQALVRALAPSSGEFAINSHEQMVLGDMLCCLDLTRSKFF